MTKWTESGVDHSAPITKSDLICAALVIFGVFPIGSWLIAGALIP